MLNREIRNTCILSFFSGCVCWGVGGEGLEAGVRKYGKCSKKFLHQSFWQSHYENMPIQIHWKCYHQKMAIFHIKKSDIFHISAQNIDCEYSLEPPQWGGSNEYSQSMFLSRNKKNNVYPYKPQFYYIKVGFKGVKII